MNEHTEQETQPAGRRITVLAFGDNVDELEMAALDDARAFFGGHWRLTVVPDYQVHRVLEGLSLEKQAAGKRYQASMTVRIVEP